MIDGIPLEKLGVAALLSIAVLLILLGRLIPKPTYDEKKEEAERWRKAHELSEEARRTSDQQTAQLLETTKTMHALLVAIFKNSEQVSKASGDKHDLAS